MHQQFIEPSKRRADVTLPHSANGPAVDIITTKVKTLLAKPGFKKAFDAREEEYTALHAILDARQAAGLTQAQVASRVGTTVSAVSRLEASLRSEKHSPSFKLLQRQY